MKKLLTLLLALMVIIPSMIVISSASSAQPRTARVDVVYPFAGHLAANWTGEGNSYSYNKEEQAVSYSFEGQRTGVAVVKMLYRSPQPYDVSNMNYVAFDLYISDVDAVANVKFELELRSSYGNDYNELRMTRPLRDYTENSLVDGWNHFQIPLSDFEVHDRVGDSVSVDLTRWHYLRFFNSQTQTLGTQGQTTTLMIKNLYFSDTMLPHFGAERTEKIAVWDAEMWDKAMLRDYSSTFPTELSDVDGDGDSEWAIVQTTADQASGTISGVGVIKSAVKFNQPIDESPKFNGIQFDIYIDNGAAGKSTTNAETGERTVTGSILDQVFYVEFSSMGGGDLAEISWKMSLRELFGNVVEVGTGKWYTVGLDIDDAYHSTKSGSDTVYDKTATNYIRIYNANQFAYSGGMTIAIDNISAVRSLGAPLAPGGATEVLTNATEKHVMAANGYTGTNDVLPSEIIIGPFSEARPSRDYSHVYPTAVNATGMDTMCFDMFVNLKGSESFVSSISNTNFDLELTSSGISDHQEIVWVKKLSSWISGATKIADLGDLGAWYHVELKMNSNTGSAYGTNTQLRGDFDASHIKFISMFKSNGGVTAEAGDVAIVALDNIYFKDSTYVPSATASARVSGASLVLTDAFDFTYKVMVDDAIVSDPVVDLTFGNSTIRVTPIATGKKGEYSFKFDGILAHRLSDTITTTVLAVAEDGQLIRTSKDYSVKEYCSNWLNKSDEVYAQAGLTGAVGDAFRRLLSDVLYYGADAQKYAGYKTGSGNLATDNVSNLVAKPTFSAPVALDKVLHGVQKTGAQWYSATLLLENTLHIRLKFKGDATSDIHVIGSPVTTFARANFRKEEGGNYYIDIPVMAANFDSPITAYFADDPTYYVTYSVNHYIAKGHTDAQTAYNALLESIYHYGKAANAYLAMQRTLPDIAVYVGNDGVTYIDDVCRELAPIADSLSYYTNGEDLSRVFNTANFDLVVVAGVDSMPADAKTAIENYMNQGGRLLTLGGPAFESTLYEFDGAWYDRDDYLATVVKNLGSANKQTLIDTSSSAITSKFTRSTDTAANGYTLRWGNYGLAGSAGQLFHEVNNLSGWENIVYRFDSTVQIEGSGLSAICFWAKAMDDHTDSLYVEVTDGNGSRWMTAVPLTEEWGYKVIVPTDFKWWQDSTAPADDIPDLNDLKRIAVGFARSGQTISQGHHSYCVADFILAAAPEIAADTHLTLDTLAPIYELYPITNGAELVTTENQVFVSDRNYVLSDEIISCHPGRQGLGFGNHRASRFVPLIEVKDEKGLHSGYAAWMHIFSSTNATVNGSKEGSMLACFSSVSSEFYNADGVAAIVETAKAMTRDVFLVEGGTNEFIYAVEDTDTITAGLSYVNLSGKDVEGLKLAVELYQGNKLLETISSDTVSVNQVRNQISQMSKSYDVSKGQPDRAVAMLLLNGKIVDKIEQEIAFWAPKENPSFIYIEDGYFKKDGEIVNFFGVNYMPSYGIAEPNGTYFENYVMRAAYDPTVIENDLDRIVDLGMNSVSVFVHYQYAIDNNNMLHLIQLCEERGLYVNLSIRDVCYPLKNYKEAETEKLITYQHFHENDNVYAYDIAWEPRIGDYDDSRYIGRKSYDAAWLEWIKVQYGSLAAAEKAWGVTLTKTAEGAPYVSDDILNSTDTKYLKVTSAYYRFLDDHIAKVMNEGILHMQSIAPDQMITFRASMSGSGLRTSGYKPSTHCFDFSYLASTLAYMEPEGYSLGPSPAYALQIAIANAYARYVQPDSPVVWKEFGQQVWSKGNDYTNFDPNEGALRHAYNYYDYTLEYCLNSYTSGMYCWYFAGGFRINENSDYGILNPDGSDRAVTTLLREYAPKFINQGERPKAEVLIEVERDNQVGGMFGIYEAAKNEARAAYDAGKFFEFVDANMDEAYDLPYADEVYKDAVADAKTDNGLYPLRYVNGMIKDVNFVTEGGKTYAEVLICNTKQSIWRAGTVSIVACDGSDIAVDYTINEDVDYLENVTVKFEISGKGNVALRFEIEGVKFGSLYQTTLN